MKQINRLISVLGILLSCAIAQSQSTKPSRVKSIHVIDVTLRASLAEARVDLQINETKSQVVTDGEGIARIELPDGPIDFVHVAVFAKDHVPIEKSWWDDGFDTWPPAQSLQVPLPAGEAIGGIVVDEAGKPIANATLLLTIWPVNRPKAEFYPQLTRYPVQTDRDGRWRCNEAPAGEIAGYIDVSHPNYPVQTQARAASADLRSSSLRIALQPGVPLLGRVVSTDGHPIAGATVRWNPTSPFYEISTQTDSNGRFQFDHIMESPARVLIRASGFAAKLDIVRPAKDAPPVEFVLAPAKVASGQIVDSAFLPLAGKVIVLGSDEIGGGVLWTQPTDKEGKFTLEIGDEPVIVRPILRGYSAAEDRMILKPGDANVLQLKHRQHVFGTVTDAETDKPIPQGSVEAAIAGIPDEPAFAKIPSAGIKGGRFSYLHFSPVKPMMIRFIAPGYEPLISPVFDQEGKTRFDVKLKRPAAAESLTGFVVDTAGKAVDGATVLMITDGEYVRIDMHNVAAWNMSAHRETTNSDGKFSFERRDSDAKDKDLTIVSFAAEGFAQVDENTLRTSPQITLSPWGKIEGEIRAGDHAYAKGRIIVKRADQDDPDANIDEPRLGGVTFEINAMTDADGKFKLDRVPPGRWQIARMSPVSNLEIAGSGAQATIDVQPGQSSTVRVGGAGCTVRGNLDIPDSIAKADYYIEHARIASTEDRERPARFANFRVEKDGSFEITEVEPGAYELTVVFSPIPKPGEPLEDHVFLGMAKATLDVPAIQNGVKPQAIDLGHIEMKLPGK